MDNKIIYASAAIALLTTFATEAVLVYQKKESSELQENAAHSADKLKNAEAEIARLKAAIETQTADYAARLKSAEAEIAAQKAQLEAQVAINADLSKAAQERKTRAEAAAQAMAKQKRDTAPTQPKSP